MKITRVRFLLLFLFALAVKCLWIGFINIHYHGYPKIGKYFAQEGVDTYTYVEPVENFIRTGEYGMKWNRGFPNKIVLPQNLVPTFEKAIRTPHYGLFYYFFSLFFDKEVALDALAIMQLLVEVLSILVLASLAYMFTGSVFAYYFVYLLYTISSWSTFYTFQIMTEPLVCGFLIFALYYLFDYFKDRKKWKLFVSGLFLSYSIAMKPFLFPVLFIFLRVIYIDHFETKSSRKNYFAGLSIICVSFILLILPWTIRNYFIYKRAFLFTNQTFYPGYKTLSSVNNLIWLWGGALPTWDGECKFPINEYFNFDLAENRNCHAELPDYVFTPDYSRDDIAHLRDEITNFKMNPTDSMDNILSDKIATVISSFRTNKPMYFYVYVPLKMLKITFIHSGSYYIQWGSFWRDILKLIQTSIYLMASIFGLIGLIRMLRFNYIAGFTFLGMFLSFIVILCFYFRLPQWRYFIFLHPLSILLAGYYLDGVLRRIKLIK